VFYSFLGGCWIVTYCHMPASNDTLLSLLSQIGYYPATHLRAALGAELHPNRQMVNTTNQVTASKSQRSGRTWFSILSSWHIKESYLNDTMPFSGHQDAMRMRTGVLSWLQHAATWHAVAGRPISSPIETSLAQISHHSTALLILLKTYHDCQAPPLWKLDSAPPLSAEHVSAPT
jgi:hypothetical protein